MGRTERELKLKNAVVRVDLSTKDKKYIDFFEIVCYNYIRITLGGAVERITEYLYFYER